MTNMANLDFQALNPFNLHNFFMIIAVLCTFALFFVNKSTPKYWIHFIKKKTWLDSPVGGRPFPMQLNYNWAKLTYLRCNTLHLRNLWTNNGILNHIILGMSL